MSNTNRQPNSNEGGSEALQALLQSISPDAAQNVTPEALRKLSDKLSELMGEDVVRDAFAHKDRAGELVNDEGLPIIDITEPVPNSQIATTSSTYRIAEEPKLVPWTALPPAERERRRRERDRILDLLEAEEELDQKRVKEKESQERKEALEKRKQAARTEIDRLNALKDTQKKMGKALLRAAADSGRSSKQADVPSLVSDNKSGTTKKSVSFADTPELASMPSAEAEAVKEVGQMDWGDVAPGRLRFSERNTAVSRSERLMKMSVVERAPGATEQRAIEIKNGEGDSDDESDLGASNSDEGEAHDDSATDYSDKNDQSDNDLEEEVDFDFAQHQREIALEYHRKRGKIGDAAATALTSHTHDADEEPSADVSAGKARPPISQFRANQLVSSYATTMPSSSTSQSLEASVLPKSAAQTLQNAIRLGKLDVDGNLVGGDGGESDGEANNDMQDILELLKKCEVQNLGPNGVPPPKAAPAPAPPFTVPSEPLPQKSKTSKFKLARGQGSRTVDSGTSSLVTPESSTSGIGRSSPKLPSRSVVVERAPPKKLTSHTHDITKSNVDQVHAPPLSAVNASPLHPPNRPPHTANSPQVPTIVESPSFPPSTSISSPMIIESPSFPSNSRSSHRLERPPVIMSSKVVESGFRTSQAQGVALSSQAGNSENLGPAKKLSRFKSERM